MPGNKSLLSQKPMAPVPVHFSSSPSEQGELRKRKRDREREREKARKRKLENSLPSEVELVITLKSTVRLLGGAIAGRCWVSFS